MARSLHLSFLILLVLLGALSVSAKPRIKRYGNGTTTSTAVKARQLTRAHVLERADKLVMANLFGREDCSIPQPSTGVCTCGLPYKHCGPQCVNTDTNIDNCGTCDDPCEGSHPGCCGGVCSDFDSTLTCGGCNNPCESGESCCDGSCAILSGNHDNCGACGNQCDEEELCCNSQCITPDSSNCGVCGAACESGETCCDGQCIDTDSDRDHCGSCTVRCQSYETCDDGGCYYA
ncbi:hypothetical protein EXIGLDRAFT_723440 [Exidia glandulosa HHB12029]|uniref:Stig1-domain-containing protein n=1 Tax=Exidia glandulosa HHB12029 TaxID=1314781 RepID=A0A165EU20_EXIGL|nr:hypothetical protein EXIGLDRAFT_723440 [Exidia glandulosa HHB12029]